MFGRLESQAGATEFHGCRYLAAQVELKDPGHPASRVARHVKEQLADFFRTEAAQGGARAPDLLARQLILVFDGASARAGIGADDLAGLVGPTVQTVPTPPTRADVSTNHTAPSQIRKHNRLAG